MCMAAWTVIGAIIVLVFVAWPKPGTLFMAAYGAFSATGVFGFMLGLRAVKESDSSTHLQQIADWLTKILLGAGLVELKSISEAIWNFSQTIGSTINSDTGPFIVVFILMGFGALGLITGYLWSQLHYGSE